MPQESFVEAFSDYVQAARGTIELFRTAAGFMPKGNERTQIDAEIERAEKAMQLAEAKAAQALGYNLCQCTFPPQLMLSTGYHPRHNIELFECSRCRKQYPSPHKIAEHDRVEEHNQERQRRSWGSARHGRTWMSN